MVTRVSGLVFVRMPDGSIGSTLAGAHLVFVKEDRSTTSETTSDPQGRYSIVLPPARYYLRVTHADFSDYSSVPGFIVATNPQQTCNAFLREPRITTALVIRHAEKMNPQSTKPDEPLSAVGSKRAEALRDVLFRAGITSIHVTSALRTRKTAEPLAKSLSLTPETYGDPAALVAGLLADHEGDVALIVAHSNTVTQVVSAFGAALQIGPLGDADFDNLFVVSRAGKQVNVANLQYANDTTPLQAKNERRALTLLMVGTGDSPIAQPTRLLHAARGVNVGAIYAGARQTAMVAPLAAQLNLTPVDYSRTGILGVVEGLITRHRGQTVVLSGSHTDLRAVVQHLRGEFPILYSSDVNHLIVLTRFASGAVRVLPMQL